MTRLFPIASTLRVFEREYTVVVVRRRWIPAVAGMTRLFPIASTLRVLLSDSRVT
jgi:hypothetical protein